MTKLYAQTPVGRLVMGSLTDKSTTDHQNRPIAEDKQNFFIGVAVSKADPKTGELLGQMYQQAMNDFATIPNILPVIQQGIGGAFNWKIDDGDSEKYASKVDADGVPTCAGCYILKMSTKLPISIAQWNGQSNVQIDPSGIKRGDFVDVSISSQGNGQADHTAGMYVNPQAVRLVGYGAAITSGPSLDEQFGGAAPVVPVGASQTPSAPAVGMPAAGNPAPASTAPVGGGMPTTPVAGVPATGMPTATASPTDVPAHPGILGGTGMPGA